MALTGGPAVASNAQSRRTASRQQLEADLRIVDEQLRRARALAPMEGLPEWQAAKAEIARKVREVETILGRHEELTDMQRALAVGRFNDLRWFHGLAASAAASVPILESRRQTLKDAWRAIGQQAGRNR